MPLFQSPEGTFYIKGVETTKAEKAGGENGFPVWTRQKYDARQKRLKERPGKFNETSGKAN